jgi:hypothetical protein
LCFLMDLSCEVIFDCFMLETVRMPRAVPIRPERTALKAVLVRMSMFVAISARKVRVSSGCLPR